MDEIHELAREQFGLLSRSQARGAGMSEACFRGLTRYRGWEAVLPGVLRAPGVPESWRQQLKALCLWGAQAERPQEGQGPDRRAAVSHRAAAALHGLAGFDEGPLEVTAPRRRLPSGWGVTLHVGDPEPGCLMVVDGIEAMNELHTLMVLGAVARPGAVERALDDALYRGRVSIPGLVWVLGTYGKRGVRGSGVLRKLMQTRGPGYVPPEGALEADFLALLSERGMELPERQVPLEGGRADFFYRDQNLVIELDGSTHIQRTQFQKDRERDNRVAVSRRWTLRFTWYDVHHRPGYVINTLVAMGVRSRQAAGR